jgi:DNA-binding beta-propeller fold protein YncE
MGRSSAVIARVVAVLAAMGCGARPAPVVATEPAVAAVDAATGPFAATVTEVGGFLAGSHGLAVDADGTLYASDTFKNHGAAPAIYTIAAPFTGTPVALPVPVTQPAGLVVTTDALIVCDLGAGEVRRHPREASGFAAAAAMTWSVTAPWNAAVLPDGALAVVTNDGALVRLSPDGGTTPIARGLDAPFDVAIAADGTLWVSEQVADPAAPGRIRRWNVDGTVATEITYAWKNPEGLALDARGYLWVADTERGELVRVAPDGAAEVVATAELPILVRRLPAGDGLLVTANRPTARLLRVDLR